MGDAPVHLAFVEDLSADHLHDVLNARRAQFTLPGDAAQQFERFRPMAGALGAEFRLMTGATVIGSAAEIEADMARGVDRRIHQVQDATEHPFMTDAAVGLGDDFHGIGDLARGIVAGNGDDNHLGVQPLRHLGVEVRAVGLLLGIDQTLDNHDTGVLRRPFIAGDDFLQQHVFLIMAQQAFRLGDRDRFRWIQAGDDTRQAG